MGYIYIYILVQSEKCSVRPLSACDPTQVSSFLRGPKENLALAEMVLDRLNAHKADNPSMGEVRRSDCLFSALKNYSPPS